MNEKSSEKPDRNLAELLVQVSVLEQLGEQLLTMIMASSDENLKQQVVALVIAIKNRMKK